MATAQVIIDKAETILQDEANDRWSEAFLLSCVSEGQREIVRAKPDANPLISVERLSSGIWQDLPSASIQLLDVTCNMGISGDAPGAAITMVDRKFMDTFSPTWRTDEDADMTKHVIYDPKRLPRKFAVYPPSTGDGYIEMITAVLPVDLQLSSSTLEHGTYDVALLYYVLFRAYAIDAEYAGAAQLAQTYRDAFLHSLGMRDQIEKTVTPLRNAEVS